MLRGLAGAAEQATLLVLHLWVHRLQVAPVQPTGWPEGTFCGATHSRIAFELSNMHDSMGRHEHSAAVSNVSSASQACEEMSKLSRDEETFPYFCI